MEEKTTANMIEIVNAFGKVKRIDLQQNFRDVFSHGVHAGTDPSLGLASCPPMLPNLSPTANPHCFHYCGT